MSSKVGKQRSFPNYTFPFFAWHFCVHDRWRHVPGSSEELMHHFFKIASPRSCSAASHRLGKSVCLLVSVLLPPHLTIYIQLHQKIIQSNLTGKVLACNSRSALKLCPQESRSYRCLHYRLL